MHKFVSINGRWGIHKWWLKFFWPFFLSSIFFDITIIFHFFKSPISRVIEHHLWTPLQSSKTKFIGTSSSLSIGTASDRRRSRAAWRTPEDACRWYLPHEVVVRRLQTTRRGGQVRAPFQGCCSRHVLPCGQPSNRKTPKANPALIPSLQTTRSDSFRCRSPRKAPWTAAGLGWTQPWSWSHEEWTAALPCDSIVSGGSERSSNTSYRTPLTRDQIQLGRHRSILCTPTQRGCRKLCIDEVLEK